MIDIAQNLLIVAMKLLCTLIAGRGLVNGVEGADGALLCLGIQQSVINKYGLAP